MTKLSKTIIFAFINYEPVACKRQKASDRRASNISNKYIVSNMLFIE